MVRQAHHASNHAEQGRSKAGIQKYDVKGIYQQYLAAFKKGVYNYIKEDVDKYTQQTIPRKYFAGGYVWNSGVENVFTRYTIPANQAMFVYKMGKEAENGDFDNAMASFNPTEILKTRGMAKTFSNAAMAKDNAMVAHPTMAEHGLQIMIPLRCSNGEILIKTKLIM